MSDSHDISNMLHLAAVILRVENLERSEAWYRTVFDLSVDFRDPTYRLIRFTAGAIGSFAIWERGPEEPLQRLGLESAFLTFMAQDLYKVREALMARGADCTPLCTEPGTRFFWVSDPDGHQILVIQLLME